MQCLIRRGGVLALVLWMTSSASAQAPRPEGGRGGLMRMLPLLAALDADGNGEISAAEMDQAVKVLKSLDRNNDGKLTEDELRPTEMRRPEGRGEERGEGPRRGPAEDDTVAQLMAFDKNADGKLSKEELPERMQAILVRADANKDGFVTREELAALSAAGPGGGRREGGRGEPGRGEFGRGGEGRGPGGPGGQGGPGGGFGRGGFGNPAAMLDRWFEFDTDKDGKLSREELTKMFERQSGTAPRGERPPE